MKGFSIIPSDAIRYSQLNSSTAKQGYMFNRQERFKVPPANCPVACYEHSGQLSNRRASLGYGRKSDFTKTSVISPASNLYEAESIFQKENSRGKSFGVSREMSPEYGIITRDIIKFPGPGKYEAKKQTLSTIAYTMRPKTLNFIDEKITYKKNPGPGTYQHPEAFPGDGKSLYAKFQNSKFAKVGNQARFNLIKDSPGPQSYILKDDFSKEGKYVQSHHRGEGTRPFGQTVRLGFTDLIAQNNISPGPGLYEKNSEFGTYGDSKYYKTLLSEKKNDTAT